MYVIIFSGSREAQSPASRRSVWKVLDGLVAIHNDLFVRVGDARGVDIHVISYCSVEEIPHKIYIANWDMYQRRAGYLRNKEMVDDGADECHLFYKKGAQNKGTEMMRKLAKEANIRRKIYQL
jgi:hypothetical protein